MLKLQRTNARRVQGLHPAGDPVEGALNSRRWSTALTSQSSMSLIAWGGSGANN